jgi:UDP-2,3-diacylglucosamine pyrophosphatase LpxH
VKPQTLILNGDIIDIWQFSKRYFPNSHLKIIKYISTLLTKGTKVYYITGNHDELFRKFAGFELGGFNIVNKLLLTLDGKKAWFFHGDVFDITMEHSKWLARLGSMGYGLLIFINLMVNKLSMFLGHGRISLSKKVKDKVKRAVKYVNNYEKTAAEIAMRNGYDYVVCGHIHQPQRELVTNSEGKKVLYLNSGDWVENMTALEYNRGRWLVYSFLDDPVIHDKIDEDIIQETELEGVEDGYKVIFNNLVKDFKLKPKLEKSSI